MVFFLFARQNDVAILWDLEGRDREERAPWFEPR